MPAGEIREAMDVLQPDEGPKPTPAEWYEAKEVPVDELEVQTRAVIDAFIPIVMHGGGDVNGAVGAIFRAGFQVGFTVAEMRQNRRVR